ncbi:MAG: hypothetical protein L3J06_00970 [Cyclobacteriaceae bacterium]|nr:hypothetical protein [Cyclobacteriaceae bacterium]
MLRVSLLPRLSDSVEMRSLPAGKAGRNTYKVLRVFSEVFLTQYISAYRFNESLNLGINYKVVKYRLAKL